MDIRLETSHVPVLFNEVMEALQVRDGGTFLDCTVGGGGHLKGILDAHSESSVVGLDRDQNAIDYVSKTLAEYDSRVSLINTPFSNLQSAKSGSPYNGILADFGLCSDQLVEERGFSFNQKAKLDMRMSQDQEFSAEDIVNNFEVRKLKRILLVGGVGKNSGRYAKAIFSNRPVLDTAQLAKIISEATPFRDRKESHPATVVFQAIRIAVNDELGEIESLLDQVPDLVADKGRLVCIAFHSLEDRLVAKTMRKWQGERGPANWPGGVALSRMSLGALLTKKAVTASKEEVLANPRARSAKMRVFEFSAAESDSNIL